MSGFQEKLGICASMWSVLICKCCQTIERKLKYSSADLLPPKENSVCEQNGPPSCQFADSGPFKTFCGALPGRILEF